MGGKAMLCGESNSRLKRRRLLVISTQVHRGGVGQKPATVHDEPRPLLPERVQFVVCKVNSSGRFYAGRQPSPDHIVIARYLKR